MLAKDICHKTKKCISLAKHVATTIEEMIEGGSIAYSSYLVLTYNPELEGEYGYGFVVVGSVAAGISEVLHINSKISSHQHYQYRIIKEALAGALVAGIFTEELLPETYETVMLGSTVAIVLTSSKALLEMLKERRIFVTKKGIIAKNAISAVYSAMMGAGIAHYLFAICKGFGAHVDPNLTIATTASLSLFTILANATRLNTTERNDPDKCTPTTARLYLTGLYGSEITLFLTIFVFDLITSIQKGDDISNSVFYTVLGLTISEGLLAMANKWINDKKEEHELPESMALLPKKQKPSLYERCCNFWHRTRELKVLDSNVGNVNYESQTI